MFSTASNSHPYHLKSIFSIYVYGYFSLHVCAGKLEDMFGSPVTGVRIDCEQSNGLWDLNPGASGRGASALNY